MATEIKASTFESEGSKKEIRKERPLWEVTVKIGLERIDMQKGVTVEALLDSGATGLVMSLEESRDLS